MRLYPSSYTLDKDTCQELAPFFWSRRRTWSHWAISAAIGIITLIVGQTCRYAYFFLVFAVCCAPTPGTRRSYCWRAVHRYLYGVYPYGRIETFFTEEGISVRDLDTCDQRIIRYRAVWQAAETEHYFLIRLRPGQWYTLVDKRCLTPEEQDGFLPFLRERCPDLKVIR